MRDTPCHSIQNGVSGIYGSKMRSDVFVTNIERLDFNTLNPQNNFVPSVGTKPGLISNDIDRRDTSRVHARTSLYNNTEYHPVAYNQFLNPELRNGNDLRTSPGFHVYTDPPDAKQVVPGGIYSYGVTTRDYEISGACQSC